MMLDFFRKHLDLGAVECVVGRPGIYVVDQHLGAIMFDTGFAECVFLDQPAEGEIEDFFLDERVDFELDADLVRPRLLAVCGFGTLELLEQILDLVMDGLQQGDRIGEFRLG